MKDNLPVGSVEKFRQGLKDRIMETARKRKQAPQWVIELAEKVSNELYKEDNSLGIGIEELKQYGINTYLAPREPLGSPDSRYYKSRLTSLMRFDVDLAMSRDAGVKLDFCWFLRGKLRQPRRYVKAIDLINMILSCSESKWTGKNVWEMAGYDAIMELRDSLKYPDNMLLLGFFSKCSGPACWNENERNLLRTFRAGFGVRDDIRQFLCRSLSWLADFRGKWDVFSDEDLQEIAKSGVFCGTIKNIPREKLTTLLMEQVYDDLYFPRPYLIAFNDKDCEGVAASKDKLLRLFPRKVVDGLKKRYDTGFGPHLVFPCYDTILSEHLYR